MTDKLKNLIRLARITASGSDDEQFPSQQLEYLGKIANGIMVFPYGMHANVTPDVLALMFAAQGHPENRFVIPFNTRNRPKLAEGEVALFHPPTGSFIKWDEDGNLLINNGSSTLTIIGDKMTFSGDLQVVGDITARFGTGNDVGLGTHKHSQGNDSDGDSEVDTNAPTAGT